MKYFSTIEQAITELKQGHMLIVIDQQDRENQGDLILSSHAVTASKINFMLRNSGGMICVPLTKQQIIQFELPLMVASEHNTEATGVNFTVSVDAKKVSSFGVSASDKALTIATLSNPKAKPQDLVRPGHVLPLLSVDEGILERQGHTEATIELLQLAGLYPVGVLCEILKHNGEVAKISELVKFSKKFNLKMVSIADLISFVKKNSPARLTPISSVVKKAASLLPTKYGFFQMIIYHSIYEDAEHVLLRLDRKNGQTPLVRIHSKCLSGDTFSSLRCDCGGQLNQSLRRIGKAGGLVLYLNQEGRGIGLINKINAYSLQDQGIDTVEANLHLGFPIDNRDYKVAADILRDLDITKIKLLSNNPQKKTELEKFGIKVANLVPIEIAPNKINRSYLLAKKQKLGHRLTRV